MTNYININTDQAALKNLTTFYGYYANPYKEPFLTGYSFVFITKPLLFIDPRKPSNSDSKGMLAYNNMCRDPQFTQYIITEQLNEQDRKIVESLSYKTDYSDSSYLPIFTNDCKGIDAFDVTMDQGDNFDTKQGYRQVLPTYKTASEAPGSISLSVVETSNLDFTKMLTLWVNYISNITDGTFDANPDMVLNGVLDYTSSIYYFTMEPDGKTLKYWCKYTGCWPTTIPYSGLRYTRGQNDIVEFDVQFQYNSKEDMNPKILEDFNAISLGLIDKNIPAYDENGYYASIKNSPLLNRKIMLNMTATRSAETLLTSSRHDPIILFKDEHNKGYNADSKDSRFELYFDDTGYSEDFIPAEMQKNYYINDAGSNQYVKEGNIITWNRTEFWDEE